MACLWWRSAPIVLPTGAVTGGALWPADSADAHEVTGNFVQEVTLPDTVRVLDSAAFYNCRKLRRVRLGKAADSFGSDLFTNCRSLEVLELHAGPGEATGLAPAAGGHQRGRDGGLHRRGAAVLPRIF